MHGAGAALALRPHLAALILSFWTLWVVEVVWMALPHAGELTLWDVGCVR